MVAAPPYMVQAYRPGQHTVWFSDAVVDDLDVAIRRARMLHTTFGRKVRVIDQEERVLFRLASTSGSE